MCIYADELLHNGLVLNEHFSPWQLRTRELLSVQMCLNANHIANIRKQVLVGRKLQSFCRNYIILNWCEDSFKIPLTCTDQNVSPSYLLPMETADAAVISVMPNGLFKRTRLNAFGKKIKKKSDGVLADNSHKRRTDVLPKEEKLHTHASAISTDRNDMIGLVMQLSFVTRAVVSGTNQYDFLFFKPQICSEMRVARSRGLKTSGSYQCWSPTGCTSNSLFWWCSRGSATTRSQCCT